MKIFIAIVGTFFILSCCESRPQFASEEVEYIDYEEDDILLTQPRVIGQQPQFDDDKTDNHVQQDQKLSEHLQIRDKADTNKQLNQEPRINKIDKSDRPQLTEQNIREENNSEITSSEQIRAEVEPLQRQFRNTDDLDDVQFTHRQAFAERPAQVREDRQIDSSFREEGPRVQCRSVSTSSGTWAIECNEPNPQQITSEAEHILWLLPPGTEDQRIDITVPNYNRRERIKAALKRVSGQGKTNVNIRVKKPKTIYDVQAQHGTGSIKSVPNVNLQYEAPDVATSIHYRGDKEYNPLTGIIREPDERIRPSFQ